MFIQTSVTHSCEYSLRFHISVITIHKIMKTNIISKRSKKRFHSFMSILHIDVLVKTVATIAWSWYYHWSCHIFHLHFIYLPPSYFYAWLFILSHISQKYALLQKWDKPKLMDRWNLNWNEKHVNEKRRTSGGGK